MFEYFALLDVNAELFFSSIRTTFSGNIWFFITQFGGIIVVMGLSLGLGAWLFNRNRRAETLGLFISITSAAVATFFLKILIARPRPLDPFYTESSFSFPSGHTALSVALYGFALYLVTQSGWGKPTKALINIFLTLTVFLIAVSRLTLGVHYVTDVVGGLLVGLLGVFVGIKIHRYFSFARAL